MDFQGFGWAWDPPHWSQWQTSRGASLDQQDNRFEKQWVSCLEGWKIRSSKGSFFSWNLWNGIILEMCDCAFPCTCKKSVTLKPRDHSCTKIKSNEISQCANVCSWRKDGLWSFTYDFQIVALCREYIFEVLFPGTSITQELSCSGKKLAAPLSDFCSAVTRLSSFMLQC